jgi:hypothetical protein
MFPAGPRQAGYKRKRFNGGRVTNGGAANIAKFSLHAGTFPPLSRAREKNEAHRITPLIRLRPSNTGYANRNVSLGTFESTARHGLGDLSTYRTMLFYQSGIEVKSGAFLLRRIGYKATIQKFGGSGRFAQY